MPRYYLEVAVADVTEEMLAAAGVSLGQLVQSNHVLPRVMLPLRAPAPDTEQGQRLVDVLPDAIKPRVANVLDWEAAHAKVRGSSKAFWMRHNQEPPT